MHYYCHVVFYLYRARYVVTLSSLVHVIDIENLIIETLFHLKACISFLFVSFSDNIKANGVTAWRIQCKGKRVFLL